MLTMELHLSPLARAPTGLCLYFSHCQVYLWSEPCFVPCLFSLDLSRSSYGSSCESCFFDKLRLPLYEVGTVSYVYLFTHSFIHQLLLEYPCQALYLGPSRGWEEGRVSQMFKHGSGDYRIRSPLQSTMVMVMKA